MKNFCKKYGITADQYYGKVEISGDLDLSGLTSIPAGFNPTVGGYLDLSSLTSIPEGFNPTVGGSLDLCNLTARHTSPTTNLVFFSNGKYVSADGIFTEIVERINENTFVVRKINSNKMFYLITDLAFTHAHGDTLQEATDDFQFKVKSEQYKHEKLTMDSIVTIEQYRAITGACRSGVNSWIESNIPTERRANVCEFGITVRELVILLERTDAYGLNTFKSLIVGQ